MRRLWMCVVVLLLPVVAQAEMPSEGNINAVAEAWLAKKPAPGFGAAMTIAEAAAVQERSHRQGSGGCGRLQGGSDQPGGAETIQL